MARKINVVVGSKIGVYDYYNMQFLPGIYQIEGCKPSDIYILVDEKFNVSWVDKSCDFIEPAGKTIKNRNFIKYHGTVTITYEY